VNVRADGLAAVLGRLLRDERIRSAALVDVDSGMVLDSCTADQARPDLEVLGAEHAEPVRVTLGVLPGAHGDLARCEVVVNDGAGLHHVLRVVPEPDGGWLALSIVVAGSERFVARVRRRLRKVSASALTAGPSTARRPSAARWAFGSASFDALPALEAGPRNVARGGPWNGSPMLPATTCIPILPRVTDTAAIPEPAASERAEVVVEPAVVGANGPYQARVVPPVGPPTDGPDAVPRVRRPAPPSALPPGPRRS
jgi:hypothetical protein